MKTQTLNTCYEDHLVREHYDIESNKGNELGGDENTLILNQFVQFNEEHSKQGHTKIFDRRHQLNRKPETLVPRKVRGIWFAPQRTKHGKVANRREEKENRILKTWSVARPKCIEKFTERKYVIINVIIEQITKRKYMIINLNIMKLTKRNCVFTNVIIMQNTKRKYVQDMLKKDELNGEPHILQHFLRRQL